MKKSALVLSGGAALGAAHIGAVRELEKKGYEFDFLAGVSAGAIIASLLACGVKANKMEKILEETRLFSLAFDFSDSKFGVLRGDKVEKMLNELYQGQNIEDLKVPLYIGATDFRTGKRVNFSSGKLSTAVRASISVPVLFEPILYQKRWLADGGLSQNFPLDIAIEKYQGDKIIGVDVATYFSRNVDFSQKKMFGKMKNLRETLERTIRIMYTSQQANFPKDKRVQVFRPDLQGFSATDIFKLKEIVKRGVEAVR